MIDYYLKQAATAPVTIEILDTAGQVIRSYTSTPSATPESNQTISVLWRSVLEPLATGPGQHRMVWDLRPAPAGGRGGGRGGAAALTGAFTVRLTANGRTLTQPLTVKPDPRK